MTFGQVQFENVHSWKENTCPGRPSIQLATVCVFHKSCGTRAFGVLDAKYISQYQVAHSGDIVIIFTVFSEIQSFCLSHSDHCTCSETVPAGETADVTSETYLNTKMGSVFQMERNQSMLRGQHGLLHQRLDKYVHG